MKVRLDLAGELDGEIEPALAAGYTIDEGTTLAELVSSLPFTDRVALTSVNGEMVLPGSRSSCVLRDGDDVMLLPAVKGG
jgi:thiamine biosynthesis protein ThiS